MQAKHINRIKIYFFFLKRNRVQVNCMMNFPNIYIYCSQAQKTYTQKGAHST